MTTQNARAILAALAHGSTLADLTTAVAVLTDWERGRKGGVILDHHSYDGIVRLAAALLAADQYVGMGIVR